MKQSKFFIALLMLLGTATLAQAQIVVSSTNATTERIYEKSGRVKGLVIRPELGITYIFYNPEGFFLSANATIAYQFNPYFAVGVGTGIDNTFCSNPYYESTHTGLPIYVNARAYFLDRKFSPYFDFKVGYHLPLNLCFSHVSIYGFKMKGLLASGTIGVQYHGFDLGITLSCFGTTHYDLDPESNVWHPSDQRPQTNLAGMLSLAYNFQFKKK